MALTALQADRLAGGALGVGFSDTIYDNGTKTSGTFTPALANGNEQSVTNGGAHTFAPPVVTAGQCARMRVKILNGTAASTITWGTNANGVGFDTKTSSTSAYATTAGISFTGSISGTTLTTSGSPALVAGYEVTGAGITAGTTVVSGSANSWVVSVSQTVGSETMVASPAFDAYIVAEIGWASVTVVGPR